MKAGTAWLFSPRTDVAVFGGSALLSFTLLFVGWRLGALSHATPDWTWVPAVLLVDVAHVWATGFRVYFDKNELARRPLLYAIVPIASFAVGLLLYRVGAGVFWRSVAYLAIFHFVRQQYGWMALYRARRGDTGRLGAAIDGCAIYAATLYPLVYWHTHAPRRFDWLMSGDVAALPSRLVWLDRVAFPLYVLCLLAYAARSIAEWASPRGGCPGKDLLVLTTAACWYVGIVAFDSDYAFTVTNVFPHGIPYIALVFWWTRTQGGPGRRPSLATILATIWVIAYMEELVWDRGVWGDRAWLFGAAWDAGAWRGWLVPLLAVPQLTHYVLDGVLWRRRSDARVGRAFGHAVSSPPAISRGGHPPLPEGERAGVRGDRFYRF
jgi:hypothetical protein